MLTKKLRVFLVVISLKRPRIQMIDFQSKDKTAYVDLVSPSQEMRFFEGLFNESQILEA
jgi:hypothetical protein